jgi:histidinol-phosphate phosphatase family protein
LLLCFHIFLFFWIYLVSSIYSFLYIMEMQLGLCDVAILAGGMGTRLKMRTGKLPKPMAPILGKPVLEYQIELCRAHGFSRIALLVHYGYETIRNHFGNGHKWGVELVYCLEQDPRGTAGALLDALANMENRFLVLYGDTYVDVDLDAVVRYHTASGAVGTLLLHPNDHPEDSDLVEVNSQMRVLGVHPYPRSADSFYSNLVNAGLYVLERDALLEMIPIATKSDLAKDTFPAMLRAGMHLHSYVTPEYIKDMGTPDRLDKVERDILAGVPERLSSRQLRHAVFLDRDGTLNVEVNHLRAPLQLQLLPGVVDAVRSLNKAGFLAVGVTNQPVLARGDVSWTDLNRIHSKLDHLLGEGKAYLDRMYVCPHHPDRGFAGEVLELKIDCDCRKPRTGMIDRAVRELDIARENSWLVGDATSDIRAGKRAGLRTILVRTGHAGLDGKYEDQPDYVMPDLPAAVDWILRGHGSMARQLMSVSAAAASARLILVAGLARAGKSSTARLMEEQLSAAGRFVHVLSLDGWLRPVNERPEGVGVLERYDMQAVIAALKPILDGGGRHWMQLPFYERKSRSARLGPLRSIGPDDVLIVEGVPALMDPALRAAADVRVFVDVDEAQREQRLQADYAWRGEPLESIDWRLRSRKQDELPIVRKSSVYATHIISSF